MNQLKFNQSAAQSVRCGAKTLTSLLIDPQPDTTEERLIELGGWSEGYTLVQQVNAAFQAGFIPRALAPVHGGQVVELIEALSHGKSVVFGRAAITSIQVRRVEELSDDDIKAEGFDTWAHYAHAWDSNYPKFPTMTNPWCWVIRFEVLK